MGLENRFIENYTPLLKTFISQVENVNPENCPQPFLPVYGKGYENAETRIVFMGWEDRNASELEDFIDCAKQDPLIALYWRKQEFDNHAFLSWGNNFGKDFWGFNLKFLARFYGVEDWKQLRKNKNGHLDILSSFAWANADAIERYEVYPRTNGVVKKDWDKVKEASKVFESTKLAMDTFRPHILILACGDRREKSWVLENLDLQKEDEWGDQLWYYKIGTGENVTHIFWIYHPIQMHFSSIKYEPLIDMIITKYLENK